MKNPKFLEKIVSAITVGLALSSPAVTPRVLLECDGLEQIKWARRINPLASGWEEMPGGYLRPFNKVPAGRLELRTAFRLKGGESVQVAFLDKGKNVVKAWTYAGTGAEKAVIPVREVFTQDGTVQYLRVLPSEGLTRSDLMCTNVRVLLDYALLDEVPFLVAAGSSLAKTPRKELLTDDYMVEFSAWIDSQTKFGFGGVELSDKYAYTPGIWYRFRFDVAKGTATLKLNGREIAHGLKLSGFTFSNQGTEPLRIDWIRAVALDSPVDYPSRPVVPVGGEKHLVGINICSLWREGSHVGWHCIDRKGGPNPVLGFYDEGLPEMADWEIKYFVEHGVDFQAFCWYADTDDKPIRRPRLAFQLEDGFKHARYSDMMKYCLIWEIQNAGRPHTLEAWKKNFVPYFIEHHFKDPRYLVLDGRPVLSVFGAWNFTGSAKGFGSAETTREAFAYLREEVRKYGFKDVILVASHWGDVKAAASLGFDVQLPYNFGGDAWKPELNRQLNEKRLEAAKGTDSFTPPAVAVGFDNVPWGGRRKPMMSPKDFEATLRWMRDDFGPRCWKKGTWQENFQWICTWNEYGEGTYIIPTHDARGFGYLDAIRSVFTDETRNDACNVIPTETQLARMCTLYPQAPWTPTRLTLTFDDGFKDHYTIVAPELEKRGWRGLFCIVTDTVGTENHVTWDDLRDMVKRGHEIATHTISHADLAKLAQAGNTNEVRRQIAESCAKLEAELGVRPRFLCLPWTRWTPEVVEIAKSCGVETMLVKRQLFGDFNHTVADVVDELRAKRANRTDFLVHGIRPEGGGWKPFQDADAFRRYLDEIQRQEKAGRISVGPYGR